MPRKTVPISREELDGPLGEYEETHPAFGQVSFHRVQGHPGKLYGSNLDDHHTFITLEVKTSKRVHHGNDWHFSKDLLIEVNLSAAQFAELLTTMNVGSGTPCTLRYVAPNGQGEIPEIPMDQESEASRVEEQFRERLRKKVEKLKHNENEIQKILEKKNIGKKDRETIKALVYESYRFFVDAAPYAVQTFSEATQKLVSSAKAEVDAFITSVVQKAGMEALVEQSKQLKGKVDEEAIDDSYTLSSSYRSGR